MNKKDGDFNQIYNYALITKNLDDLQSPGLPSCEIITSRHDTYSISINLQLFRSDCDKIFGDIKHFSISDFVLVNNLI